MIPATVLLGSMAAGGLGLYLSGSTGAPSTGIAKTVEDSVSSIADQVTKTAEYVSPKSDDPQPVTPVVQQPVAVEPVVEEKPVESVAVEQPVEALSSESRLKTLEDRDAMNPMQGQSLSEEEEKELADLRSRQTAPVENRAVAPSLPEIDSMAGGQRGGFGRPTWAPLNSGTTLFQAIGVEPGSTAGNVLATVTGSKTPQQIQQELVNIDRQIRELKTKQFLSKQKLGNLKTTYDTATLEYRQAENKKFSEQQYLAYFEKEIKKIQNPEQGGESLYNLLLTKFPTDPEPKEADYTTKPEYRTAHDAWKQSIYNNLTTEANRKTMKKELLPKEEKHGPPKVYESIKSWWNRIASTGKSDGKQDPLSKLKNNLDQRDEHSRKILELQETIDEKKPLAEEATQMYTALKEQLREIISKLAELNASRELLLKELSTYKVPQKFFDKKDNSSVLPTGEALNKLLIEYRQIEDEISQNEREKNDYVSIQLESNPSWTGDDRYTQLGALEDELKRKKSNKIAEIEGRSPAQVEQLKALSELDTFIKQLKDQKVKGVSVFDNPDFRKVFDMLTVMSLDTDAKSFIVNLDKYSNFFVTTKGFSAYNGEVLDKVFYFFNNYETLIKDATTNDYIEKFATAFNKKCGSVNRNIQQAKTVLSDSGNTTTEEFKKLDATQRRILEGRSTAWHTFFTDSDTLKAIPKALSSSLFKTELDKLVKLEGIFKRRILDKIDKTKFETVVPTGSTWISWFLNKVPSWPTLWKSDSERVAYLKRLCEELKPVIKQELDSVFQTNKNRLEKKKMLKQRTDENLKRSEEMKRLRKAMDSSVDKTTSRYSKLLEMYNELELKIISEEKEIVKLRGIISELPSQDEHIKELVQIMKNLETDCVKWMPAYYDRARMGSRFQTLFEEFLNSLGTKPIATYDQFKILAANYVISRVGRQSKNDKGEVVKPQGTYTEKEFNELFEREVARLNLLVRYNICKFQKGQRVRIVELSSYGGKPAGSEGIIDQVIQCKAHDSDTENKYTVLFDGDTTATEGVLQSILESVYGPEPPPQQPAPAAAQQQQQQQQQLVQAPPPQQQQQQQQPAAAAQQPPPQPQPQQPAAAAQQPQPPPPAQVQDLVKGDYVQLRAGADVKYPDKICLLENSAGSTRIRVGKIINLIPDVDPKATVQCYNKTAAGAFTRGDSADYFQKDLEIVVKPDGLPKKFGGGYTRRHLLRGMPKRAKTRRTY